MDVEATSTPTGTPSAGQSVLLSRNLNLLDVTFIGVGAMVGAGIFVLTGIAAGQAGPALLLAFVLNGLVTMVTAASYAELGSCLPEAGGGFLWVREGLGKLAGFLAGWMSWFAHAVACSVYALGFGAYLAELIAAIGWTAASPKLLEKLIALTVAVLFAFINYRGAKETSRVGNLVTAGKILILATFALFGLSVLIGNPNWPSHFSPFFATGAGGVLAAMGLTFIAFEGYEIIAQSGEEVRNPRRTIPLAIFLSIGIVVFIYLIVAFVALGAVDSGDQPTWQYLGTAGETAMIAAARQLLPGGALLLIVGGLMSTTSALNATVYSSSRVSFAMGRAKALPLVFGGIHPQRRTPHWAIGLSTVIIVAMLVFLPIKDVASAADIMFLLLFCLVNASLIALRRKRPDLPRGFRVPFVPVVPLLGVGLMAGLAIYLYTVSPEAWMATGLWIGVGMTAYYGYAVRQSVEPRAPVVEQRAELTRDFRVILSLARSQGVGQLAPLAAALAGAYDGEVLAVHVEVVPPQLPLSNGRRLVGGAPALLQQAQQAVSHKHVPAHTMLRIGHDAVSGIVEATREAKASAIVIGWRPTSHRRGWLLGKTLDPLLADPPCNVLVWRAGKFKVARTILVPMAGGPNAILAMEYALGLAERWDSQVTIMTVVDDEATAAEVEVAEKMLLEAIGKRRDNPRLHTRVVAAVGPAQGILVEAAAHDLVMIGASREGVLDRVLFGTIPERVAAESTTPIIVVKRRLRPVTSWSRHLLDWVSARLPHLAAEERIEAYKAIRSAARPDVEYFVMTALAAGIAGLGLLLNSPAVIVGAMLVAPLMAAIAGLGMGMVMGDMRMVRLAAGATTRGTLLAVAVGVLAGYLGFAREPTAEMLSRAQPTLLDLGVALISGAAGAYALCRKDVSAALPGVAIAAALVPPLATVGISLAQANWTVAGGAFLLFTTNLIAISAASAVVFLLFGFRPPGGTVRISVLRRGVVGTALLLALVVAALSWLTVIQVNQAQLRQAVREAVVAEVGHLKGATLVEFNFEPRAQDVIQLEVTIRSQHTVSYEQTVALQEAIAAHLNRTVALLLTVIPSTQLSPHTPPTPVPSP
jgi:uncharacterized hydrophobic protein (TIGR00271 family)